MSKRKMLNNQELSMFCDQIAMVLNAGITPMEGIQIMLEDTSSLEGKDILKKIYTKCEEGESFYTAVSASGVFPKYALDMIDIGEKSGKLEDVMNSLAFHYNREENISKGIKNAVSYPLLIVFMMLVVIFVLVIKVLPIFNDVFAQLGKEMTGISKTLTDFGSVISKYSIVFVIILAFFVVLYFVFAKTEPGKKLLTVFLTKFAGTRSLYDKIAAGRFASGMALTMSAGLDTDDSLKRVGELVDNIGMASKISMCRDCMSKGYSFADALSSAGIFSGMYARMITVGYKTGAIDKVLLKIANGYEDEVDEKIGNMISILEPTLVIVLSVIVCLILLSVMLPLMGIMSSIG